MLEHEYEFTCPYCGETLVINLDQTAGENQEFVYDCEVCCKPIHIAFKMEEDDVIYFSADVE